MIPGTLKIHTEAYIIHVILDHIKLYPHRWKELTFEPIDRSGSIVVSVAVAIKSEVEHTIKENRKSDLSLRF